MLLYSLAFDCPFPFPASTASTLSAVLSPAYRDTLYTHTSSDLRPWTRQLQSALSSGTELEPQKQLRSKVLPLPAFEKKWSNEAPAVLEEDGDKAAEWDATALMDEAERELFKAAKVFYDDESRKKQNGDTEDQVQGWILDLSSDRDWLDALELRESFLQALLLLSLLALPDAPTPASPTKGKKSGSSQSLSLGSSYSRAQSDSQRLDPELLLDLHTDRMAIWQTMNSLSSGGGFGGDDESPGGTEERAAKDRVMQWWSDVVEPLFATKLATSHPTLLSHHRTKLFPPSSLADALTDRSAVLPSPFKPSASARGVLGLTGDHPAVAVQKKHAERSLLSLDRAQRERKKAEELGMQTQSPTMKKLMTLGERERLMLNPHSNTGGARGLVRSRSRNFAAATADDTMDVEEDSQLGPAAFKKPRLPSSLSAVASTSATLDEPSSSQEQASTSQLPASSSKKPRKQAHPQPLTKRPLVRADSIGAGLGGRVVGNSKSLFNTQRREVVMLKKPKKVAVAAGASQPSATLSKVKKEGGGSQVFGARAVFTGGGGEASQLRPQPSQAQSQVQNQTVAMTQALRQAKELLVEDTPLKPSASTFGEREKVLVMDTPLKGAPSGAGFARQAMAAAALEEEHEEEEEEEEVQRALVPGPVNAIEVYRDESEEDNNTESDDEPAVWIQVPQHRRRKRIVQDEEDLLA